VTTTRRMRRIKGEKEPRYKLSELTPAERLEAMNVHVRDLKPLLKCMSSQKLADMRILNRDTQHNASYRDDLSRDTRALCLRKLLRDNGSTSAYMVLSEYWLALTTTGIWIYYDAKGYGSDETGYRTTSAFSAVSKRDLLDMLQGEPGKIIAREVISKLLQLAANVIRSREQQAKEFRRVFDSARVTTSDVIDLQG
jgi:hypothetical protein